MRLAFVAVAASVLGVGANSEPHDVSSARLLLAGSTEVSNSNEEERGLPNQIAEELGGKILNDGSMLPLKRLQTFSEEEPRLKRLKAFLDEPVPDYIHQQLEVHEKMDKNQAKFIMDLYEIITNFKNSMKPYDTITNFKNSMDGKHETSRFKTLIDDLGKERAAMVIAIAEEGWGHVESKGMRRMWIKDGIEPDVVFLTILDAGKKKFLNNAYVYHWIKYVREFNKRYPTKQKHWIDWLEYDDITLLELASSLTEKKRGHSFTNGVRTKLHHSWRLAELTPDEVFTRLHLQGKVTLDFDSLPFMEWIDFVYELERQSAHKSLSYIMVLVDHYQEDGFFAMFREVSRTPITKRLALDFRSYLRTANHDSLEKIGYLNGLIDSLKGIWGYRYKIRDRKY